MRIGGAAEGLESGSVLGMLPIQADGGEGEGVVAEGGKVGGLFAPEAVDAGPVGDVEDFAAEEGGGGLESVVVGGGAEEEAGVARGWQSGRTAAAQMA